MLTRIISGAVLIAVVAAVLALNCVSSVITVSFLSILAIIAVFEILYNTGIIKNKTIVAVAAVFAGASSMLYAYYPQYVVTLTVFYVLFVATCALILHKCFKITEIASAVAFPIMIAFGFSSIYAVFNTYGIAFLLLVLNFSAVCDTGAYFTGVTFGKHKLCSEISPKKTVEGAVGGIVFSLIVTVIIALIFNLQAILVPLLIFTPILCIVGMVGDLFASIIKRAVGIKDYGKLIPGHGGILDRFDSILLIAPAFVELLKISFALIG